MPVYHSTPFTIREYKVYLLYTLIAFSLFLGASCSSKTNSTDITALNFWNKTDFQTTDFNEQDETMEGLFVEYLQLLSQTNPSVAKESMNTFLNKASNENDALFNYFIALFEKYLYNPNSPIRDEHKYMIVLDYLVQSPLTDDTDKTRYISRLSMLNKNGKGKIAEDFEYTTTDGTKHRLSQIQADYLIIFFNNPDCHSCNIMKDVLNLIVHPQIKIMSLYPDDDLELWKSNSYPSSWINGYNNGTIHQLYDLKAIPTLYLLDKDKRVILKDTSIEELIEYLEVFN